MPSLRTFRIEFDQPGATYTPGDLVTGNVYVDITREKTVRALKLSVKGEANVSWYKKRTTNDSEGRSTTHTDHFRANEQYFNLTYYLLGNIGGHEDIRLPVGFHRYPFNFQLPYNIPCSFEHKDGHIRYTTKAVIDRPWRFDHECKIAFTVVASYDLNAYSHHCIGINDEMIQTFCCVTRGTMNVCIKIPTTGFVPGQSITTMVNFDDTSGVNVTRVCVKLERSLEFHAKAPYHTTKKDKMIVKGERAMGPFGQHCNIVLRLQVPPIPPSQLEYCSIIDQKYTLRFTIHVSGWHCKITKTYPILIGTIPLRSAVLFTPAHPQSALQQPTAPVMQYDHDPPPPMPMSPDYGPPNLPYPNSRSRGFSSPVEAGTSTSEWDMPPPSYEECMHRADSIKDDDESNYVHGANQPFAPRYPVFNFPTPHPSGSIAREK